MEDAGTEEVARIVDGLPLVGGAGDALDGVPCGSEVISPSGHVAVVRGGVVREDAGGAARPHGIVSAENLEIMGEGLSVGGVVVEDEPMPFAIRLNPPNRHVIGDAEIPTGVDGAVWLRLEEGGEMTTLCKGGESGEIDGAVRDGRDGFIRRGGEFLTHF